MPQPGAASNAEMARHAKSPVGKLAGRIGTPLPRSHIALVILHPPQDSRQLQSIKVTTITASPTAIVRLSRGGPPIHRPNRPLVRSHGPTVAATKASKAPPALARTAWTTWPRVMCAHEVVIPHDGQRIPYNCT